METIFHGTVKQSRATVELLIREFFDLHHFFQDKEIGEYWTSFAVKKDTSPYAPSTGWISLYIEADEGDPADEATCNYADVRLGQLGKQETEVIVQSVFARSPNFLKDLALFVIQRSQEV